MGSISITKLLVIAVIVVLLFGTKKLSSLGSDLGAAIKGFKKALNEDDGNDKAKQQDADRLMHKEESTKSSVDTTQRD